MRVLFITSAYPDDISDPRGIHIHRLAASLVRAGAQLSIVAPGSRVAPRHNVIDGVNVHRVQYWWKRGQVLTRGVGGIVPNVTSRPWLAAQVLPLISALAVGARRYSKGHDIVHAHWFFPAGIAAVVGSHRSRPLVVTSHGGDLNLARKRRLLRPLIRRVAARSDALIGVSDALTEDLHQYAPDHKSVHLIPLGVDPPPPGLPDDWPVVAEDDPGHALRLLYVGSLIPRKSVRTLIEATTAPHLRDQVSAVIVGDGPDRRALEELMRQRDSHNVSFVGSQPPSEVGRWMTNCDVLVLPSLSEGRPVVVMEAMAAGKCVLATDIPGTRELVSKDVTGLLFSPGSSEALTSALQRLVTDRTLATRMGHAGMRRVAELGLSSDATAAAHLDLYQSVLGERARRSGDN